MKSPKTGDIVVLHHAQSGLYLGTDKRVCMLVDKTHAEVFEYVCVGNDDLVQFRAVRMPPFCLGIDADGVSCLTVNAMEVLVRLERVDGATRIINPQLSPSPAIAPNYINVCNAGYMPADPKTQLFSIIVLKAKEEPSAIPQAPTAPADLFEQARANNVRPRLLKALYGDLCSFQVQDVMLMISGLLRDGTAYTFHVPFNDIFGRYLPLVAKTLLIVYSLADRICLISLAQDKDKSFDLYEPEFSVCPDAPLVLCGNIQKHSMQDLSAVKGIIANDSLSTSRLQREYKGALKQTTLALVVHSEGGNVYLYVGSGLRNPSLRGANSIMIRNATTG